MHHFGRGPAALGENALRFPLMLLLIQPCREGRLEVQLGVDNQIDYES